ncbi:unnamed protein product, partial [Polarella glacialis]
AEVSPAPGGTGTSDMWSVGVVAYLLLVGHNPFRAAQKLREGKAVEAEVVRLVARGRHDVSSPGWLALPEDARQFIGALLKVWADARLSATEALRHPFLTKRLARCPELASLDPSWRRQSWSHLSGLQRLAWGAVARAVAEPELSPELVSGRVQPKTRRYNKQTALQTKTNRQQKQALNSNVIFGVFGGLLIIFLNFAVFVAV